MNRANRYLKSLGSNYLLLVINVIYTLASVPVALHFLTKEEFGVWIVIGQISTYLAMIDLGKSYASIRLLIDHKDSPNGGAYGSLIKCTMLVQFIQAPIIFLAGAWTKGRIQWHPINDWLLAFWFILSILSTAHNTLVSTKRVQAAKFIYFIEGAVFIAASIVILPRAGIPGMLSCSIICTAAFTLAYGARRVAELARLSPWRILFEWLGPAPRFMVMTLPIGIVLGLLTRHSQIWRLAGCVAPLMLLGAFVAGRYCVPRDIAAEFVSHLPRWSRRPAGVLLGRGAVDG
jgi:hypothetical protein